MDTEAVAATASSCSATRRLALSPGQVRLLRRHFLYRSAGLGFWSDGRKGMGERRVKDKLEREVFHG